PGPQRPSVARQDVDAAHAAAAHEMAEPDARAIHLALARRAAQLVHRLPDLRQSRRAAGVSAREKAAVRRERNPSAERRAARLEEALGFARRAEAEQLVVFELLDRERVVALDEIDVLGAEPGLVVGFAGRIRRHLRRTDDGAQEGVARGVGLALQ